jgi:hypothetical protein
MGLDEVEMGVDKVERVLQLASVLGKAQGLAGQAAELLAEGQVVGALPRMPLRARWSDSRMREPRTSGVRRGRWKPRPAGVRRRRVRRGGRERHQASRQRSTLQPRLSCARPSLDSFLLDP